MRRHVLGVLLLTLPACGLDEAGQLHEEDSGTDVVTVDVTTHDVVTNDVVTNDVVTSDVVADSPIDVDASDGGVLDASDGAVDASDGGSCPLNACTVANVPNGWDPIAYKENASSCPATFNGTAYVTNPTASGSTCACGCTVGQSPVCDVGTTNTFFSGVNGCGQTGISITFAGSGCTNINTATFDNFYKSTAIPPSGGTCNASPTKGAANTTSAESCAPTVCKEDICAGNAPLGYAACIETPNDVACPGSSPFTVKHLIGTGTDVTCSNACTCNVSATCVKPKIAFYSDNGCTTLAQTFDSDNTCVGVPAQNRTVTAVKYAATVNASCTPGGTTSPTLDLTAKRTVCCRP